MSLLILLPCFLLHSGNLSLLTYLSWFSCLSSCCTLAIFLLNLENVSFYYDWFLKYKFYWHGQVLLLPILKIQAIFDNILCFIIFTFPLATSSLLFEVYYSTIFSPFLWQLPHCSLRITTLLVIFFWLYSLHVDFFGSLLDALIIAF